MKKTFGIIGAGNIAQALARHLLKSGNRVIISSRKDPADLAETVAILGEGTSAGTPAEAAQADIVVLAMPWSQLGTLTELTDWSGRTVIDATNHFITFIPDFQLADLGGRASSQVVADHIPGAHLVKAFNTLNYQILEADPQETNGKRVIFISGDYAEANAEVRVMIENFGFSVVDLGTLADGSKLQQAKGPLNGLNLIRKS